MWPAKLLVVKWLLTVMQSSDLNADVILNGGLLAAMLVAILKNNPAYVTSSVLKMLCAKRQSDPTFRLAVIDAQTDKQTDRQTNRHLVKNVPPFTLAGPKTSDKHCMGINPILAQKH